MWIALAFFGAIIFLIWCLSSPFYWWKRNVPFLFPLPIFGNFLPILSLGILEFNISLYKKFPGKCFYGLHMFIRPTLFVKDPKLVQRISVTDFEYFTSHGLYGNPDIDPASGSLFHIYGQEWKEMRAKLSPYFTPAKVKLMLSYADRTICKAINVIDKDIAENKLIEMKLICMNITTDVITQAIFGIETDTFVNEDSIFNVLARAMFTSKITTRLFLSLISPTLYDLLNIHMLDDNYRNQFIKIVIDTIEYRRRENVRKEDFLQGMMDLVNEKNYIKSDLEQKYFSDNTRVPRYDMDSLISQAILLYAAGVETSALTMTYFFYEMAKRSEFQDKCRAEIDSVVKENENNEIRAEDLPKLVYLGAALQETLRMHAPVSMINRECTKNYKVPGTDIILEKGTMLLMTPNGSQMDPEYFPEPEQFKPERFMNGSKIVNGSFYPFGLGPRTCLGMGLANAEMKLVTAKLLQRYEFLSSTKTDVTSSKYNILKTPEKGMWLIVRSVKKTQ